MIEIVGLRAEAGLDVPQALAKRQLRKSHRPKLLGASEAAHPAVAAISRYAMRKRTPRKKIHQLRKQHPAGVDPCLQSHTLETESNPIQMDTTQKCP
jgi:predicted transcriptional regulator